MADRGDGKARDREYELGHSDRELQRLTAQARLVDPFTRQFFRDAGVLAGMRVLDIGSGAGDAAFLVAGLVGADGEVVGTDRSPIAIDAAQARAKARGHSNVSFREGDPATLTFEQPFDAIVGRYVLMFNADPVAMLKGIAGHLRPGGVIVFHEADWSGARSFPPAPTYDRCCEWIIQTFGKVGTNSHMGLDLHSTFLRAGLPAPTMALRALVGGGSNKLSGVDLIADLGATMGPVMEEEGIVTADELDTASLKDRMLAEVATLGSVVIGRFEIGAWSRIPS